MKYGERLKTAREHAGLSQTGLAERARVGTQENVSKLERGNAEGSEFTVQYALACGVNAYWLATGEGEMIGVTLYVSNPRIVRVVTAMQQMKEEDEYRVLITSETLALTQEKLALPPLIPEKELAQKREQAKSAEGELKKRRFQGVPKPLGVKSKPKSKSIPAVNPKLREKGND